ncbi:uncharacterized protein DS421_20g679780 [Arachis hypogaea]|nr:uncharacterized protein DS421_20g679780 [Arachis hypogaea]
MHCFQNEDANTLFHLSMKIATGSSGLQKHRIRCCQPRITLSCGRMETTVTCCGLCMILVGQQFMCIRPREILERGQSNLRAGPRYLSADLRWDTMGDERSLYRLNGVAHIAGAVGDEPTRCIYSVRRQQNMPMHERIILYLERAGLYHLARLNSHWFWLDELLVSVFVERWHPETHTFHMPFGECTVTLQDVAFQLGLPVDGWADLFSELPPPNKVKQMTVHFIWFHERFRVLSVDATEDTVRIYARTYIIMLLSTQLFGDKSANQSWIFWRFPSLRPPGFEVFSFPLASRVINYRLALDRLTVRDIVWEPYSALDVLIVVHLEILMEEHCRIWRAVTTLIYFAVIEWHQTGCMLRTGGEEIDPGPSSDYLDWWYRAAHRFLSPGAAFTDPRGTEIPPEAFQRGSSQVPCRSQLPDMPDNRRIERRRCAGTRDTGREWRWLDDMMQEDDAGRDARVGGNHRVRQVRSRHRGTGGGTQFRDGVSGDTATQAGGGTHIGRSYSPMPEPKFAAMIGDDAGPSHGQFDAPPYHLQMPDVQFDTTAYHPYKTEMQSYAPDYQGQYVVDLNEPADPPVDDTAQEAARPARVRRPTHCGTGSHLLGPFDAAAQDDRDD